MVVAILVLVAFLATWQILGALGLTNKGLREDAAKKIAKELHRLMMDAEDIATVREATEVLRGLREAREASR